MERRVALDSRSLLYAEGEGVIEYVDAKKIVICYDRNEADKLISFDSDTKTYELVKFRRTNQDTTINHRPIVVKGQRVSKGEILS